MTFWVVSCLCPVELVTRQRGHCVHSTCLVCVNHLVIKHSDRVADETVAMTTEHMDCVCVGCVDTLTSAQSVGMSAMVTDNDRIASSAATSAVFSKDDYSLVNRFESTSAVTHHSLNSVEGNNSLNQLPNMYATFSKSVYGASLKWVKYNLILFMYRIVQKKAWATWPLCLSQKDARYFPW